MGRKIWLVNLLLAGMVVAVGWRSWLLWTTANPLPGPPAADSGPARNAPPAALELPALPGPEEFKVIEEKNLFTQSRAPAAPAPPPPVDARPATPPENISERYILYGVVRLGPSRYFAVIRDRKTPNARQQTFRVGDKLPGSHILRKIEDQRVLISTGSGEAEIRLRTPKGTEDTAFVPRAVPAAAAPGMMPNVPGGQMPANLQRPGTLPQPPAAGAVARPRRAPMPVAPAIEEDLSDEEDLDMQDEEEFYDEEDEE